MGEVTDIRCSCLQLVMHLVMHLQPNLFFLGLSVLGSMCVGFFFPHKAHFSDVATS